MRIQSKQSLERAAHRVHFPSRTGPVCQRGEEKVGGEAHTAVGERDGGGGEQSGGLGGVQHTPTEREGRQHDEYGHTKPPLFFEKETTGTIPRCAQPAVFRSIANAKLVRAP